MRLWESLVKMLDHADADERAYTALLIAKDGHNDPPVIERLRAMLESDADVLCQACAGSALAKLGALSQAELQAALSARGDISFDRMSRIAKRLAPTETESKYYAEPKILRWEELTEEEQKFEPQGGPPNAACLREAMQIYRRGDGMPVRFQVDPDQARPAEADLPGLKLDLAHQDMNLRYATVETLARMAPSRGALDALLAAGLDAEQDDRVKQSTIEILDRFKEHAAWIVPHLDRVAGAKGKKAVKEAAGKMRVALGAAAASAQQGPLGGLIADLRSKNAATQCAAARALAKLGAGAAAAAPDLASLLQAKSKDVRSDAAWALGRIGPAAAPAVPALVPLLRERAKNAIRGAAAEALAGIGPVAASAIPDLLEMLKTEDDQFAAPSAVRALANLGCNPGEIFDAVAPKIEEFFAKSQTEACLLVQALEHYGKIPKLAWPLALKLLRAARKGDANRPLRESLINIIGAAGPAAREAIPDLAKAAREARSSIPLAAARALVKIAQGPAEEAYPALIAYAGGSHPLASEKYYFGEEMAEAVSLLSGFSARAAEIIPVLEANRARAAKQGGLAHAEASLRAAIQKLKGDQ